MLWELAVVHLAEQDEPAQLSTVNPVGPAEQNAFTAAYCRLGTSRVSASPVPSRTGTGSFTVKAEQGKAQASHTH